MDAVTKFLIFYFLPIIALLGFASLIYTIISREKLDRFKFASSVVVSTFTILFGTLPFACYTRLLDESFCNMMVFVLPTSFFLVSLLLWLLRLKTRKEGD